MKKLEALTNWISIVVLGITPLFFLPTTSDYYDFNKWTLLAVSSAAILFLFGLRLAFSKNLELHWSPAATGLLALTVAASASTLTVSDNYAQGATHPLGIVTYMSLFLLTVSLSLTEKKQKMVLFWFLSAGAGVAGLVAVYTALGLANPLWSPLGSALGLLGFLMISLPLSIGHALRLFQKKEDTETIIAFGISIVTMMGIGVTLWQLTKEPIQILPFSANWSVFLESIKQPLHLAFGVGPQNFLAAYTAGRPEELNISPLWNARFTLGSSFLFHQATTVGVLGVIATALLLRSFILSRTYLDTRIALFLVFLALFFLPPSLPIIVVTVTVMLLASQTKVITFNLTKQREWIGIVSGGLLIIAALVSGYLISRVYLADIAFGKAVGALSKNDGRTIYALLLTAINHNPTSARYHAALSQTSLLLASAILNRASDTKTALSDKDKQLVTDFYQQAIREAKIAINAAPTSVIMWENLASIYRGFLGIATNADAWTIAALNQTIALDPTNPLLRISTGNVYLRTNRIDEAIRLFQSAVALKDDLANAHYSLAFAYRAKKQYLQAAIEFRRTSQLVPPRSTDADRLTADIAEIMDKLSPEEITSLWQTPALSPTISTEEILSPVVEFQPIPAPKLNIPDASLSP